MDYEQIIPGPVQALVDFLKSEISAQLSPEDILAVFERMCAIPMDDDMILFETGTFSFAGKEQFYFSLVRQLPGAGDEYYQIHTDILFEPSPENMGFGRAVWNIDIEENIFDFIRKSPAYACVRKEKYSEIQIFATET